MAALPRLGVAVASGALGVAVDVVEAVPRRVRIARRQLTQLSQSVAEIGTNVSAMRNAVEPLPPTVTSMEADIGSLSADVHGLRRDMTRLSAQLQQLVDTVPDLKPDGLLDRARGAVGVD